MPTPEDFQPVEPAPKNEPKDYALRLLTSRLESANASMQGIERRNAELLRDIEENRSNHDRLRLQKVSLETAIATLSESDEDDLEEW